MRGGFMYDFLQHGQKQKAAIYPLPFIILISTSSSYLLLQTRPSFPLLFISVKFLCFPPVSFLFLPFLPLFLWFTAPNAINCNKKDKYFWNQTENTNLVVFFFLQKWTKLKFFYVIIEFHRKYDV